MRKAAGKLRTPHAQMMAAVAVMLAGGYLIAVWVMGLILVVCGLLWAADALLRDIKPTDEDLSSHQALLRRYQNSP